MLKIIELSSWKLLKKYSAEYLSSCKNSTNASAILSHGDIILDYSAQYLNNEILNLLFQLAEECNLQQKINDLFLGSPVNFTEQKPALHWALRAGTNYKFSLDNCNVIEQVQNTLADMGAIADQLRAQTWLGFSGKPITDIVNIGIGGSYLGSFFCLNAFSDVKLSSLNYHFISDFDPYSFSKVTINLNPETTLFIVSSKSFTTLETVYNFKQAVDWLHQPHEALERHFIAVTAAAQKARELGIHKILPIWDWVGGRYSLCSAINLITCIAIGFTAFKELLLGAASIDDHFRYAPFAQNLPVHLALIGIWNNNFLDIHQLLLLTYAQRLDHFTAYIQQLDMESNGKNIDQYGRKVNYATGPIVWGGSGCQAQHSYYQLLCQGTHNIAADLISVDEYSDFAIYKLCVAQKTVLSTDFNQNHELISGHNAINHIRLHSITPRSIGALIALYEHKIYVQSVIWQINPFNQPGVESSKRLMHVIK